MGQRTQVLLKTIGKDGAEEYKGIHYQWGFGRVMPRVLMAMLDTAYLMHDYDVSVHKKFALPHRSDWQNVLGGKELKRLNKSGGINVNNPQEVFQKFFKHQDNNNGGMVVEVIEDKERLDTYHVRLGFFTGREDDRDAFQNYVSPRKYMEQFKCYCKEEFIKAFELLMQHHGVKQFGEVQPQ